MTEIILFKRFKKYLCVICVFWGVGALASDPAPAGSATPPGAASQAPVSITDLAVSAPTPPAKISLASGEATAWLSSGASPDGSIILVTVKLPSKKRARI